MFHVGRGSRSLSSPPPPHSALAAARTRTSASLLLISAGNLSLAHVSSMSSSSGTEFSASCRVETSPLSHSNAPAEKSGEAAASRVVSAASIVEGEDGAAVGRSVGRTNIFIISPEHRFSLYNFFLLSPHSNRCPHRTTFPTSPVAPLPQPLPTNCRAASRGHRSK